MSNLEDAESLSGLSAQAVLASPVRLVVLRPENSQENDFVQESPPFKLCHGATHRLEVGALDGSTWVTQPLGLRWMSSDNTLPSHYGLSASPRFITDTEDAEGEEDKYDFYKNLSSPKVDFTLTSDPGDSVQSGDVTLGLSSYWQAPKYPFDVQVGDYWYGITDLQWDGTIPIVEGGKPTTLTATVSSAFDDKRLVQGTMVEWTVGRQAPKRIPTDADGQSALAFTIQVEDIEDGYVAVKAHCIDAFAHETTQKAELRAFVTTPWDELMTLVLREKDGPTVDPSVLGMRLARGGRYELALIPGTADDYFVGHMITMNWFESSLLRRADPQGEKQLGIDFDPKIEREMTKDGLTWDIIAGEESGEFKLQVWSSELGEQVPFLLPGVQMSADLADEAELKHDAGSQVIFHRGVETIVRMVPKANSPLAQMKLTAKLGFEELEEEFPKSQAPSKPPYNSDSDEVTKVGVEWTLEPLVTGNSGRFGLRVEMPGFTTALKLPGALAMFSELGNEAQVFIDDKEVDMTSIIWHRQKPGKIELRPRADIHSPLGKTTLQGWLMFIEGSLSKDEVPVVPAYYSPQPMTPAGLSWMRPIGEMRSGTFGLSIQVDGFKTAVETLEVLLMSELLHDELQLFFDHELIRTSRVRVTGQHFFKVYSRFGSPLAEKTYQCRMVKVDGVNTNPGDGQWRALEFTPGLGWTLFVTSAPVEFDVELQIADSSD